METKRLEEKLIPINNGNNTLIKNHNHGETLISWADWWARYENEPAELEIELSPAQTRSMGIYL